MVGARAIRALLGELSRRSSSAVLCAVLQFAGAARDAAGQRLWRAHGNPAELSFDLETGDIKTGSATRAGRMSLQTILLFAAMEFVFSITPGPAVMLVTAYGFRHGARAGFFASLGIEAGNTIYLLVSAAGLGAVLATSSFAFEIVKWAGAAYLVILGALTIWKAGREVPPDEKPRVLMHPFVQALLTQLGNPKSVLFFGALLPPRWPT